MLPMEMRQGDTALIAGMWRRVVGVAEDAPETGVVHVLTVDGEEPWTLPAGVQLDVCPLPVNAQALFAAVEAMQADAQPAASEPLYRVWRLHPDGRRGPMIGQSTQDALRAMVAGARGANRIMIRRIGGTR